MKAEYKEFYEKGRHDVIRFVLDFMPFVEKHVNYINLPTVDEDKKEHWDVELCNSKSSTKIDVKGLKKINRTDSSYNDDYHWIELVGNAGYPGWVRGKAKYIALECREYWLLVDRQELLELAKFMTSDGRIVYESKLARGNLYQRVKWGHKDETTLVYKSEIMELSKTKIIKKLNSDYIFEGNTNGFKFDVFGVNFESKYVIPENFITCK